jgi:hypothetical protein
MCDQCNDSNQEHVRAVLSRREALIAGGGPGHGAFLGKSDLHRAGGSGREHGVASRQSCAFSGGEGPGHRDGMVELRQRQGRFEILAARSDRQRQFQSTEGRVDVAAPPMK